MCCWCCLCELGFRIRERACVLYIEVSYSASDRRDHKSREARRYRLKAHMKKLKQDCIVNILQAVIEKKDALIEDLYKEMDKLRQLRVQAPEKAGANKDAPSMVRERRGGHGGRTNGVSVFFWGLQKGC